MTQVNANTMMVAIFIALGVVLVAGLVVVPTIEHQQAFAIGKSPGYGRFNNPGIEHRPPCSGC
jgi:hypothetical protein